MDLLGAQFNSGHLSLEDIKTVLGNDFANWGVLSKKFTTDSNGLWYNVKAEETLNKRKEFTQSRLKNLKSHKAAHMENENEIINKNLNNNKSLIEIFFIDIENSSQFETIASRNGMTKEDLKPYLESFKLKSELEYPTFSRFVSHFKNFVINERLKEKGKKRSNLSKEKKESALNDVLKQYDEPDN